ncbi:MAG: T9SS type A sorting domain-containing protein [Bacteroidia bacterium]|jgi:hypothetical protein|nr:T9SS type A sorting domain-containing protein [Bacteroidia bacterium]
MKKIAAVLFLMLTVQHLCAQSPTQLYGLSSGGTVGGFYLATLNPATGLVTEISPQPIAQAAYACYATIDPVNNIYYFSIPDSLVGVSISTGLVVNKVAYAPNTYFEMPQYNCRDSLIYGLYSSLTDTLKLATIDPQTGNVNVISPVSVDIGFVASTRGSLDPSGGIYYFHGVGSYKGLSLSTGQIVYSCNPVFSGPGLGFELSLWDCEDSALFGLTSDPVSGALIPAVMDMQTGAVTSITTTGVPTTGYYMCTAEINPPVDLFHYSDVNGFRTFNMTTGNLLASVPLTFSPTTGTQYFDWIARDNCKCFLSPIGIEETVNQLAVSISPNPAVSGDYLSITLNRPASEGRLVVFDALGRMISSEQIIGSEQTIRLSTAGLAPGMYSLQLFEEQGVMGRSVFVVH